MYNKTKPPKPRNQFFESGQVNLPPKLKEKLDRLSDELRVPFSILIGRAIDHELERTDAFERDLTPTLPPLDDERDDISFSQKLFTFIQKNPGLSLEHLVLSRIDVGIMHPEKIIQSYHYLLSKNLIEEYKPSSIRFSHPYDHRVCRVHVDIVALREEQERRYKKVTGPATGKGPLDEV